MHSETSFDFLRPSATLSFSSSALALLLLLLFLLYIAAASEENGTNGVFPFATAARTRLPAPPSFYRTLPWSMAQTPAYEAVAGDDAGLG